jgi:hypothetical protein
MYCVAGSHPKLVVVLAAPQQFGAKVNVFLGQAKATALFGQSYHLFQIPRSYASAPRTPRPIGF